MYYIPHFLQCSKQAETYALQMVVLGKAFLFPDSIYGTVGVAVLFA
jgi:hypothetical protein